MRKELLKKRRKIWSHICALKKSDNYKTKDEIKRLRKEYEFISELLKVL